ncbi:uncharacterized protein LOC100186489 [Ciona intestinalis]
MSERPVPTPRKLIHPCPTSGNKLRKQHKSSSSITVTNSNDLSSEESDSANEWKSSNHLNKSNVTAKHYPSVQQQKRPSYVTSSETSLSTATTVSAPPPTKSKFSRWRRFFSFPFRKKKPQKNTLSTINSEESITTTSSEDTDIVAPKASYTRKKSVQKRRGTIKEVPLRSTYSSTAVQLNEKGKSAETSAAESINENKPSPNENGDSWGWNYFLGKSPSPQPEERLIDVPSSPETDEVFQPESKKSTKQNHVEGQDSIKPTPKPTPRPRKIERQPSRQKKEKNEHTPRKISLSPTNQQTFDLSRVHYLVVEAAYHGRALLDTEKAYIQHCVTLLIEKLLRGETNANKFAVDEIVTEQLAQQQHAPAPSRLTAQEYDHSSFVKHMHLLNNRPVAYKPSASPPSPPKCIKLSPQSRPQNLRSSPRYAPYPKLMREIPTDTSPSNMQRHSRNDSNDLAYQNMDTMFKLSQNESKAEVSGTPAATNDAAGSSASEDSVTRLINFMNSNDRSSSVTSKPRHYRRKKEALTPSGKSCDLTPRVIFPPSATASPSGSISKRVSISEPSLINENKILFPTPTNIQSDTTAAIPGGDLIKRTPIIPPIARSPSVAKLRRQSAKPNDHDAWWMPREWAQERCIGAFGRGFVFEAEKVKEREKEAGILKEANIEKIRTCNFIRF